MAFKSIHENFILVYLDDIILYSTSAANHFGHLRQVFIKCREFGVSLNPRKCVFATNRGKLLRHIVLGDGPKIDPKSVKEILSLPHPHHKKGLQSFLARINFVRRFIPSLSTMVKPLTTMINKNMSFSSKKEGKATFEEIKEAISLAPTLINPNFDKEYWPSLLSDAHKYVRKCEKCAFFSRK